MKKGPPGSLGDLLGIKYYPVVWGALKTIILIKQPVIRGKLCNQFFFRDSIYTGTVKKFPFPIRCELLLLGECISNMILDASRPRRMQARHHHNELPFF